MVNDVHFNKFEYLKDKKILKAKTTWPAYKLNIYSFVSY